MAVERIYVNDYSPPPLTIDDLKPRFPAHTLIILSYDPEEDGYSLEITPTQEFWDHAETWPWLTGLAYYGPTSESVINQADEALRKVKR